MNKNGSTSRKRSNDENIVYSCIKRPITGGTKLIKIEIYDLTTGDLTSKELAAACACKADVCVQHVIKNSYMDDVYICMRELITKIENNVLNYWIN